MEHPETAFGGWGDKFAMNMWFFCDSLFLFIPFITNCIQINHFNAYFQSYRAGKKINPIPGTVTEVEKKGSYFEKSKPIYSGWSIHEEIVRMPMVQTQIDR